jgi:hypothetical protein
MSMPSNVEMAILALLVVNLLATLYSSYRSDEDYAPTKAVHVRKTAAPVKGQRMG